MSTASRYQQISRPQAMETAVKMRAAGWSISGIKRILALHGVEVRSNDTIIRWTDPVYAERRRAERKAAERERWRQLHPDARRRILDEDDKIERILELRRAGLSFGAIGIVAGVDFKEPLTDNQVRYAVKTGRYPRRIKSAKAA